MSSAAAWLATATALACAVAVAGCGFGAGASSPGTATLTVTRDYGSRTVLAATDDDPPSSETVIRFLDDEGDITTRYGGGFVQSIDGLGGTGSSDWFFYVNGVESAVGAAEVQVKGGDRIWWDYRNWSAAMSVPAVVGSWPQPFAQASSDQSAPALIQCRDVPDACRTAKARLAAAAVTARIARGGGARANQLRMVVGTWPKVKSDPAVDDLQAGPASTGVFATFKGPLRGGRWRLVGLDQTGTPARTLGSGAGLVAALGRPPTWIVTGSGPVAVLRAARSLRARFLRNHYAVAALPGKSVPLPILGSGAGS
jgi:Domain of unknown function (DUF4430)